MNQKCLKANQHSKDLDFKPSFQ